MSGDRQKLGNSLKEKAERTNPAKILTLLPAHLNIISAQCSVGHHVGSQKQCERVPEQNEEHVLINSVRANQFRTVKYAMSGSLEVSLRAVQVEVRLDAVELLVSYKK